MRIFFFFFPFWGDSECIVPFSFRCCHEGIVSPFFYRPSYLIITIQSSISVIHKLAHKNASKLMTKRNCTFFSPLPPSFFLIFPSFFFPILLSFSFSKTFYHIFIYLFFFFFFFSS